MLQYNSIDGTLNSLDKVLTSEAPSVIINAQGLISHSLNQQTTDEHFRLQIHKSMATNWDEENGWVALRIQALNFPFGNFFKQLESIYEVGLLTSLHRSTRAKIRPIETQKYTQRLNKNQSMFDKILSSEAIQNSQFKNVFTGHPFVKYDFSDIRPYFEEVLRGESVTTRGIAFWMQTCLTRKSNGTSPPLGSPFQVTLTNKNTGQSTVYNLEIKGENRCLNLTHKVWYKHFKPETLISFDIEVREMSSKTLVGVLPGISINPWDEGWTFGRDNLNLSPSYLRDVSETEKIQSRFFLPEFKYFTLRFRYAIDKFLNLKVKKSILLHLSPSMIRYNSRRLGRDGIYSLRDGLYLLKIALEKQYLDPSTNGVINHSDDITKRTSDKFSSHEIKIIKGDLRKRHHISIVKRLVRVIEGRIIAPVEFSVRDLRIMRIRSQMMIQIEPVEEWRHYMVKLYNNFYERQIEEIRKENQLLRREIFERLYKEKLRNIDIIIADMSKNERMIHQLIAGEI